MKQTKRILEWIPIIGQVLWLCSGRRGKRNYLEYPDSWFVMHIVSGGLALIAIAFFIGWMYQQLRT
jgi:hypothetical protein